jgi:uncharacterized membrane protein
MTVNVARQPALERHLAYVLHRGTWLATGIIALGLALPLFGSRGVGLAMTGEEIVTAGIACLILLPVLRVMLMLVMFVHEGDYRFGAIATLVLAIIVLGAALGVRTAGGLPG